MACRKLSDNDTEKKLSDSELSELSELCKKEKRCRERIRSLLDLGNQNVNQIPLDQCIKDGEFDNLAWQKIKNETGATDTGETNGGKRKSKRRKNRKSLKKKKKVSRKRKTKK